MFEQRVFDFGRTRRALLAGVLGLILGLGAASVVAALGPIALLKSAEDNGDGKITIKWSLTTEEELSEHETYHYSLPTKVCVKWRVEESNEEYTETCFTEEISNQDDLLVDTGGNEDTVEYLVLLVTYYDSVPMGYGKHGTQKAVVTVTGTGAQ